MSDNIPFDIQMEIIKRLPIKSVLRFRSVSKPWNSFIISSEFITDRIQPQRLIAVFNHHRFGITKVKFVIGMDDDNFYHQKFPHAVPVRSKLEHLKVIDCSHGLLCFYGYHRNPPPLERTMLVNLWNPSIRKSVGIIPPYTTYNDIIGFGVCPVTNDPTLVNISQPYGDDHDTIPWKVKVFTLSTGNWKTIVSGNKPWYTTFEKEQVVIDRFIYWSAEWEFNGKPHIVSFDMCSQEFEVIHLPDSLSVDWSGDNIHLSKLTESLVVLEYKPYGSNVCGVWMMDGVTRSFEKRFTIKLPMRALTRRVRGFRHSGEPIVEMRYKKEKAPNLKIYERCSRSVKNLGIHGFEFFVRSYVETLLLLDQEDSHIYIYICDKDDDYIAVAILLPH